MRQSDRVLFEMELKVVAPSLMSKEAVLVVQYTMYMYKIINDQSQHLLKFLTSQILVLLSPLKLSHNVRKKSSTRFSQIFSEGFETRRQIESVQETPPFVGNCPAEKLVLSACRQG